MVAGSFNAVVARGDRVDEVTITLESPGATVDDLLAALGIDLPHLLIDDEQVVPGDHALVEVALRDGALLRGTSADGRRPVGRPTRTALEVVGGPESGNRAEVPAGTYEIRRGGRANFQLASEAVSAVHAAIEVDDVGVTTIEDRASFNGTWVNGVQVSSPTALEPDDLVRIGNAELRVRPEPDDVPRLDRTGNVHAGTLPFNRPPRTALPDPVAPVPAPEAPRDGPRTSAFSIFAIIGPLLFAGVMVVVLGNIRFAIFAVLSPIMALGTFFDSRRRSRKTSRKDASRYAEEVAAFDVALDEAAEQERRRRELVWPHPGEVCRRAELPSTRLWERRAHAEDFLVLRWDDVTRLVREPGGQAWDAAAFGSRRPRLHHLRWSAEAARPATTVLLLLDAGDAGVVEAVPGDEGYQLVARSGTEIWTALCALTRGP